MPENCVVPCSDRIITLRGENGKKAKFLNPDRHEHVLYDVDGCLIKGETACDAAIELDGTGLALVEFKGKDVAHAVRQLISTGNFFRTERKYSGRMAGLVVASVTPSGSVTNNNLKAQFARAHGGNLRISSSTNQFELGALLRFGG